MRTLPFLGDMSRRGLRSLGNAAAGFAGLAGALMACAPAGTAATSTTAADVSALPSTASSASAPAPREAPQAVADPPGQLVCRTRSASEGTAELFLVWNEGAAKGTLRRVVPSGMVYLQPVRAERHNGALIVDERSSTDLASHAAVVGEQHGKPYMRVGDAQQAWSICE